MDFSLTEEQELLKSSVSAFLRDRYSFERRQKVVKSDSGWQPDIWTALAEQLGILALPFPESTGGLEQGPVTTMIVMEELGRKLLVEPYLETVVLCGGLLREAGGTLAESLMTAIGTGDVRLAFAWAEPRAGYDPSRIQMSAQKVAGGWSLSGVKIKVDGAPWASKLVVCARTQGTAGERGGLTLFLVDVDKPGLKLRGYPTVDGRRAADVECVDMTVPDDAVLGPVGGALEIIEKVFDAAIAGLCAEAVGLISQVLQDTIEYTRQRKQFGQPISSFQVLQHRMVDMFIEVELARSATLAATLKLSEVPLDRALAVSAAKVTVAKACRFVGQNAVQLHGGMGLSDGMPVSHYFKRATVIETLLGSADYHLQRYLGMRSSTAI